MWFLRFIVIMSFPVTVESAGSRGSSLRVFTLSITIQFISVLCRGALDDAHSKPASCGKYASHGATVCCKDSCVLRKGGKPKILWLLFRQPQLHELGNTRRELMTTDVLVNYLSSWVGRSLGLTTSNTTQYSPSCEAD